MSRVARQTAAMPSTWIMRRCSCSFMGRGSWFLCVSAVQLPICSWLRKGRVLNSLEFLPVTYMAGNQKAAAYFWVLLTGDFEVRQIISKFGIDFALNMAFQRIFYILWRCGVLEQKNIFRRKNFAKNSKIILSCYRALEGGHLLLIQNSQRCLWFIIPKKRVCEPPFLAFLPLFHRKTPFSYKPYSCTFFKIKEKNCYK